jgi:pentose-5-phosphate-3-epimerase
MLDKEGLHADIEVDGGVSSRPLSHDRAGATGLVAAARFFHAEDPVSFADL